MGKNIVIIIISVCLVASLSLLVFGFSRISNLESSLEEYIVALDETRTVLSDTFADYEATQQELSQTNLQLAKTETELLTALSKITDLEIKNINLQQTAEQNKFYFYYGIGRTLEKQYSLTNLERFLDSWNWKDEAYKAGIFDCSEMAALLECRLENMGFHTVVAIGDAPDGSNVKHAWLLVECEPEKYMPVEPTAFSVVYWHHRYFDNYFRYERSFEDIQQALAYSPTEFDWWD